MLLSRYSNIDYILKLDVIEGFEIISKAYEKELERNLWDRWLIDYKNMTKDTFISFEEYKKKLLPVTSEVEKVSKEDLLKMAKDIENKITQKRGD